MKYPKTIAVQWMKEENEKWLNATEEAENLEDGEIAVYTLTNKVRKETRVFLYPKKG